MPLAGDSGEKQSVDTPAPEQQHKFTKHIKAIIHIKSDLKQTTMSSIIEIPLRDGDEVRNYSEMEILENNMDFL